MFLPKWIILFVNDLAQEKLLIQEQINDELEKEIIFLEKRNRIIEL